jgi:Ca2+-binding RTX toxin-like protein
VYIAPVLTATANNDVLVGLDIAPTFTIGTFTGIKSYDLRIGSIIPRAAATYSIGSSSASFLELYANNIYSAGSNLTLAAAAGNSIAFVNGATESARLFATTGNFTLQNGGTFTDAGYRLDVTGTTRLNGNTTINGKLDVAGSVRIADDVAVASASNVGAMRYRESATTSYSEMCMRTGATAYAWIVQVENNW